MKIDVSANGTLTYNGKAVRCALGRGGVNSHKTEGDGITPVGCYPIRRVLYRSDRIACPETKLPVNTIVPSDGWCDDPADPKYNMPVTLPYPARTETMWRDDDLYNLVVILGHNDDPPVPGAGSAIFLHVARPDYGPTEGCVAIAISDLLALLKDCTAGDLICISEAGESRK